MHRLVMLRTVLTLALALPFVATAQVSSTNITTTLDSIVGSVFATRRAVGVVAVVVKGNDTLLSKSYGRADVEWDVPMPVDAMFEVGSITKQFTAAAVLQLRDAGKLSLDDDVTKWLADFDTRGNTVTVRRLLDHTSGIQGMTEMPEFANLVSNPRFPRDSAYALIRRYPFQFPTGTAQIYNNSAFWLLGLVIEKASGMSYKAYVEQRLFQPLGMTHSTYCNSEENVARRAHGYTIQNGSITRAMTNVHTWPFAAGSICSTARDLMTWLTALHGGRVLSPRSYAEMITPAKLADGSVTQYGMGIGVGTNFGGQRVIGHGGTIEGFRSEANWYPDAQLAVLILSNSVGGFNPGDVATEISARLLPWRQPSFTEFTGDATTLVGRYQGPSRGRDMVVEVTQTQKGLAFSVNGSPARLLPHLNDLTWQGGAALLTFRRDGAAGARELHFSSGGGTYYVLRRL